jgi:hypothetical protein
MPACEPDSVRLSNASDCVPCSDLHDAPARFEECRGECLCWPLAALHSVVWLSSAAALGVLVWARGGLWLSFLIALSWASYSSLLFYLGTERFASTLLRNTALVSLFYPLAAVLFLPPRLDALTGAAFRLSPPARLLFALFAAPLLVAAAAALLATKLLALGAVASRFLPLWNPEYRLPRPGNPFLRGFNIACVLEVFFLSVWQVGVRFANAQQRSLSSWRSAAGVSLGLLLAVLVIEGGRLILWVGCRRAPLSEAKLGLREDSTRVITQNDGETELDPSGGADSSVAAPAALRAPAGQV